MSRLFWEKMNLQHNGKQSPPRYKENKCRICSCLFGNYENTGNCYIPSEINCELTRHVNNIFREKYSEEQVAMLRKHYRREL